MTLSLATTAQGRIVHHLVKAEGTLLNCLVQCIGLNCEDAARLVAFGAVYQNRHRVDCDRPVSPGEYIRVHLDPRRFPVDTIDWQATVVHEESAFVVVNKPAGIPVHATLDNRIENVLHQLSTALGAPLHITQRLDVEVGGLIVFGKTPEFQREFNRLLVERNVTKKYHALVETPPEAGRHIHYMKPTERGPKTVSAFEQSGWLPCALTVLDVRPLMHEVDGSPLFEVEIKLETGRTHQIRSQLSAMGSPIVGDALYGSKKCHVVKGNPSPGIALFSAAVSWIADANREQRFILAPPW